MIRMREAMALRLVVAIAGIVPVAAGLAGVWRGAAMVAAPLAADAALDSHFRYLSGLLLAVGLGFWSTIPHIEQRSARFRLLTALVVVGGCARLLGVLTAGPPPAPMIFALVMELGVTPVLCWWQSRVAIATPQGG